MTSEDHKWKDKFELLLNAKEVSCQIYSVLVFLIHLIFYGSIQDEDSFPFRLLDIFLLITCTCQRLCTKQLLKCKKILWEVSSFGISFAT